MFVYVRQFPEVMGIAQAVRAKAMSWCWFKFTAMAMALMLAPYWAGTSTPAGHAPKCTAPQVHTERICRCATTRARSSGSSKTSRSLLALQSDMVKPLAEKAASYSRHLYDIVSGNSADFTKAFESTSAESQKTVTALLENSLKNAPAGSEAAVAVIKSAMTASINAVASVSQKSE